MSASKSMLRMTWQKKSLILVCILGVFFLTRLPFYFSPFDGQDGNGLDADIFLRSAHEPNYFHIARVSGESFYTLPQHPGFLYESMKAYGIAVRSVFTFDESHFSWLVAQLKFWFSLPQVLLYVSLILWTFTTSIGWVPFLGLAVVAILSKLSILSSNELQPDTFVGILTCGIFGVYLASRDGRSFKGFKEGAILCVLSALIGIGKSEWTVCFASAWLGIIALSILISRKNLREAKPIIFLAGYCLVGVALGNGLSLWISEDNYYASWGLLGRMVTQHSMMGQLSLKRIFNLGVDRFPFIAPIMITLLSTCFYLKRWLLEKRYSSLALFIVTLSFFTAFYSSLWLDLHRYFAPAFALSLSLLAILYRETNPNKKASILLMALPVWTLLQASTVIFLRTITMTGTGGGPRFQRISRVRSTGDVSDVFGRDQEDYIHGSVAPEDAEILFTSKHQKHPCKPH